MQQQDQKKVKQQEDLFKASGMWLYNDPHLEFLLHFWMVTERFSHYKSYHQET
jgi:hypothetical protein